MRVKNLEAVPVMNGDCTGIFVRILCLFPALQGVEVRQERENGILLTNRSLVVQEVTRSDAGRYTCQASNVEGDSTSPPVILAVQC